MIKKIHLYVYKYMTIRRAEEYNWMVRDHENRTMAISGSTRKKEEKT